MTWWRHDSSLWSRSLIHRYAQRILRDNEAALRTRGFSRTLPNSAQHEESSKNDKCPESMSNLEWKQLQQYKRWRKQLQEDPYKALFGASEDMLSGKGLKDWDWVYKSFPRWMLNDIDIDKGAENNEAMKRDGQGELKSHEFGMILIPYSSRLWEEVGNQSTLSGSTQQQFTRPSRQRR